MNRARFLTVCSYAALISTVFTGCSTSSQPAAGTAPAPAASSTPAAPAAPAPAPSKPAEPVTLTLLIGSTGTPYPATQAVAAEAEKKLNIKIKFDIKPDGTEGDNLVKTRLATGEMADILYYNSGSLLKALNPEENFVDLTNEPFMANPLDSYKETVTSNGKVFGVPGGSSNVGGILYNKKVYAELGLTVPKTWAEFIANSDKIKASGKTAIIGSYKTTWTSQLFVLGNHYNVQAQVPNFVQDYTANKAKYATTPAAMRGFEMMSEVFKKNYYNKDFLATTYDTALKMLAEGTGVQYPMLTSAIDALAQNYPDKVKDIGVFPTPSDNASINGFTVWMPNSYYINKKSKNIDAAKKFIDFLLSPEGQKAYMSKSKANGPYVVKGIKVPDDAYEGVKDMQPYFDNGKTAPALEFVSPVKGPNLESILIEVGTGQKSPADGAADYDKDVRKQAQQLNLPGW
ncbi:extracellular solute-binding protein [Paenibacillus radicis (ex Xue et al. 2023)]|uniref:ABC transporter substrate-binding protein n=1 Tax=Paenibacillus radicis (ex Xue et al. 2023) TaxID=2972489 RepID=A0ABT1YBW0_9BACL|nr:ABC transporter substrate-binding protein [Paenibacillus radicis (ex Xue et al. 2023)]MCR8630671.1 ABC transporter substrate-binding protein [Paenibacillus radicis (ex Xue et al. 2023)]